MYKHFGSLKYRNCTVTIIQNHQENLCANILAIRRACSADCCLATSVTCKCRALNDASLFTSSWAASAFCFTTSGSGVYVYKHRNIKRSKNLVVNYREFFYGAGTAFILCRYTMIVKYQQWRQTKNWINNRCTGICDDKTFTSYLALRLKFLGMDFINH